MKVNNIQSCVLGPEISPEEFIPEHYFLYLLKGSMEAYDGEKHYTIKPGDYCIARKNHLARYTKYKDNDQFEKIIITFDEPFLRQFLKRHPYNVSESPDNGDSYLFIKENKFIKSFVLSLEPYYLGNLQLDSAFADIKREELLLVLLKTQPQLSNVFFSFGIPGKVNLEEYMNKNFRFNLSLGMFAYFTGRSISSFKRDFRKVFGTTPGSWLKKKRLEEAYYQLSTQNRKPGEVYAEVGFEDLSHFSYAFKQKFGASPNEIHKTNSRSNSLIKQ